jgi:hypothetical protein
LPALCPLRLCRFEMDEPQLRPLPGAWDAALPAASFGRLLLVRTLREEKLSSACTQ